MEIPETRYAKTSEGVHIAYQVIGSGSTDLVVAGAVVAGVGYSNVEFLWHLPPVARYLRRLASSWRIVLFDPRGMGLSDPLTAERLPTLETRMADAAAVMDAVGSERAAVMGTDSSGALAIFFAATYPARTTALILFATGSCGLWMPDYPWGWTDEEWEVYNREVEEHWGEPVFVERFMTEWLAPGVPLDEDLIRAWATYLRVAASPGTAVVLNQMERDTDVRHILPTVQVPTLVLHRTGDRYYPVDEGRYLAARIPGARFVELDGSGHGPWDGDVEVLVSQIEGFMDSVRGEEAEFDRVLATILFTDFVDSTERAAEVGDRAWGDLVERHHAVVRAMLARYHGIEVDTAGDGFFATFDGPARAIRCARSVVDAVKPLGIEVRAGVHTGEVESIDEKVGGIAVSIGSRVGALAGPSDVLVSQTVKDLVAGSGLEFEDRGEHELKGVPDRWRLYRVAD